MPPPHPATSPCHKRNSSGHGVMSRALQAVKVRTPRKETEAEDHSLAGTRRLRFGCLATGSVAIITPVSGGQG